MDDRKGNEKEVRDNNEKSKTGRKKQRFILVWLNEKWIKKDRATDNRGRESIREAGSGYDDM